VAVGNQGDEGIAVSLELFGWDDDLDTGGISSIWDWMVQEANGSDDFASWLESILSGVAWITDDDWSLGGVLSASDTSDFVTFEKNFINVSIEHVCSTMDGTKSGEASGRPPSP